MPEETLAIVLAALPVEYRAIRDHLQDLREIVHPRGTIYERGTFAETNCRVALAEIGPGNLTAAAEAERAIDYFNPRVALFVGVAGGIKDVSLGDVVVATNVYGYHAGKANDVFEARPDVGQCSYDLVQRARAVARRADWLGRIAGPKLDAQTRVQIAPIAAGEQVVASAESATYRFLRAQYGDAVAVEMEGRGFLGATHANQQVSSLVIRGISDHLADKAKRDAAGWQEIAARHAAAFAFATLARVDSVGRQPDRLQINWAHADEFGSFDRDDFHLASTESKETRFSIDAARAGRAARAWTHAVAKSQSLAVVFQDYEVTPSGLSVWITVENQGLDVVRWFGLRATAFVDGAYGDFDPDPSPSAGGRLMNDIYPGEQFTFHYHFPRLQGAKFVQSQSWDDPVTFSWYSGV